MGEKGGEIFSFVKVRRLPNRYVSFFSKTTTNYVSFPETPPRRDTHQRKIKAKETAKMSCIFKSIPRRCGFSRSDER